MLDRHGQSEVVVLKFVPFKTFKMKLRNMGLNLMVLANKRPIELYQMMQGLHVDRKIHIFVSCSFDNLIQKSFLGLYVDLKVEHSCIKSGIPMPNHYIVTPWTL